MKQQNHAETTASNVNNYELDEQYDATMRNCYDCNTPMHDAGKYDDLCKECADKRWNDKQHAIEIAQLTKEQEHDLSHPCLTWWHNETLPASAKDWDTLANNKGY